MPPNIPQAGAVSRTRQPADCRRLEEKEPDRYLGQAVPRGFKVSRGLDGSPADDVFPDDPSLAQVQQPQMQQQRLQQGNFDGDISQFMNLDQADHGFYGSEMQH